MFESILIRRHLQGQQSVDAGTIAEILLFYERVHLVAESGLLSDILRVIGPENLLKMLDANTISLTYLRDSLGVITNTSPTGIQTHNFAAYRIGTKTKRRLTNSEEVERTVEHVLGKSRETRRTVKHLLDKISFRQLGPTKGLPKGFPSLAREDLHNGTFVQKAVEHTIRTLVPSVALPDAWSFEIAFDDDESFLVSTNLDFKKLNEQYHKHFPPEHSSLSPAYLLSFLLNARSDAYFAADYMSEIVTTPVSAGIINAKFEELLYKRGRSAHQIELFQTLFLNDARAIRGAVNSGERTFTEFLSVLERAQQFKTWLRMQNADAELLREYYKAATAESWVDRLPSKSVRFALTTLGGLAADLLFPTGGIGTAIGVGAGAIDSLLLDRLLKGWRPNQFIENELTKFVSGGG